MMKQMPYRVEEGAIERAKYRAKMAVRESANGAVAPRGNRHILRWVMSTATVAAMLVAGFFFFIDSQRVDFDEFVAEMREAPLDVVADMTAGVIYYADEEPQF